MKLRRKNGTPLARKVGNAPIGLAVAVVLLWVAETFGLTVPEEVAMSFVTIIQFAVGWATREAHDREPIEPTGDKDEVQENPR